MKIRADFVTNSSSSSYVDIYADNPALNELLEKYNGTTDYAYEHFTTDYCDEHEKLKYSNTLLEFLSLVRGGNIKLKEEFEEKKTDLLGNFRYAKYNTGFHYTDGYLSGEEHHITLSSRWGVVDQYAWIDEDKANAVSSDDSEDDDIEDADDEYDDDNEYADDDMDDADEEDNDDEESADDENDEKEYNKNLEPYRFNRYEDWETSIDIKEKPTEATANFAGVRPEDLEKRTDLSSKMKLVIDNLSKEPVKIQDKKFVFIGDYDHYLSLTADDGLKDEEDDWDECGGDNENPWGDREYTHKCIGNIHEIGLIASWLSRLGGKIKSIRTSGRIGSADYIVVRLDSWAEQCIDTDVIQKAIENNIPIISEYQLWKAIFG